MEPTQERVFSDSDLMGLIFKSVLSRDYPNFALINSHCYKVYNKFVLGTLKRIPRRVFLRYAIQTFKCGECNQIVKAESSQERQCSDHKCLKTMCQACYDASYKCKRCIAFRGFDLNEYRKTRRVCRQCLMECVRCKKKRHCFRDCHKCERKVCLSCLGYNDGIRIRCRDCLVECNRCHKTDIKLSNCIDCQESLCHRCLDNYEIRCNKCFKKTRE